MRSPKSRLPRVDEEVRGILRSWSKNTDRALALKALGEAANRLPEDQRLMLEERMAEIALGFLAVIDASTDA